PRGPSTSRPARTAGSTTSSGTQARSASFAASAAMSTRRYRPVPGCCSRPCYSRWCSTSGARHLAHEPPAAGAAGAHECLRSEACRHAQRVAATHEIAVRIERAEASRLVRDKVAANARRLVEQVADGGRDVDRTEPCAARQIEQAV